MTSGTYVEVVVPVPVPGTFIYRIPEAKNRKIVPGIRVVVPFGQQKTYTAVVIHVVHDHPAGTFVKDVLDVLDDTPLLTEQHFTFWSWIADYYMCTGGEVMDAALPRGLKPQYLHRLLPVGSDMRALSSLGEEDLRILELLQQSGKSSPEELAKQAGSKRKISRINHLVKDGYIRSEGYLEEKYKPKIVRTLTLSDQITSEEGWHDVLDGLGAAPRQKEIVLYFLRTWKAGDTHPVFDRSYILRQFPSPGALDALIRKGFLVQGEKQASRLDTVAGTVEELSPLNDVQQASLTQIKTLFTQKDIVLLHGITSSGKTEIYFHLIREMIEEGKQVLYLLPEIAITSQMIRRLMKVFGARVAVYHSRYSENERVETWLEVAKKREDTSVRIILGVRSAIFLPFRNLGLIIIDEEHETTYKQQNPAPRYHARDMATVLAQISGAKVILGTATPSIESYHNARTGKYGFSALNERYTKVALPEIRIVDMKKSFRRGEAKGHLSEPLYQAMISALNEEEQVILFQNRRGFSPFIQCNQCGWIPYCRHCDVRLTWHKSEQRLECHYCGYHEPLPAECPQCGSTDIRTRGFGTEKVEDELALLFPSARILRLDLDTAHTRKNYEKIIRQFEEHRADILIGTQMITKGLDFGHVQVVGILNADNLLHYPDFRAWERSFQLMTQVSGRAGRQDKQGSVYIQTWDPEHPVLQDIVSNNYFHMYETQLQERKSFGYPPFFRLVRIHLKHRKPEVVNRGSLLYAGYLRNTFPGKVLGPESPVIPRIRNLWEKQILLKIEREANLKEMKMRITRAGEQLKNDPHFKSLRIIIDVDPY